MNTRINILIFCLVLLSFFTHIYKLNRIPPGLDNDEVNKGYDAYSLLKTGRDQWGSLLPIYFKGFGDYRGELYTYSLIPSISYFGLSALSVRLPAVLISVFTILATILLGKKLFSTKTGLAAAFFLSNSPWFFGMTRIGVEAPVAAFFMIIGTTFFVYGLRDKKYFIVSSLSFILSVYMYHAHRIMVPFFILCLIVIYYNRIKPVTKEHIIAICLFLLCIVPLGLILVKGQEQRRISQVLFTNDIGIINRINEQRFWCEKELGDGICKLVHNRVVDFSLVFVQNYVSHFSLNTLFLTGFETTLFVMPPGGLFLYSELPIFLLGFYLLIKKKTSEAVVCLMWLLLAPIPDSFTGIGHYHRFILVFPSVQLISGYGLAAITKRYKIVSFILVLLASIGLFVFWTKYFGPFRIQYSRRSHYEYIPLFKKLFELSNKYSNIYISNAEYDTKHYIFYLFYKQYDPAQYQQKTDVDIEEEPGGWIRIKRIGKWHFISSLPDWKTLPENSLVVGGSNEFRGKKLQDFINTKHLNDDEAFYMIRSCTADEHQQYKELEKRAEVDKTVRLDPSHCYY